MTLVLRRLALAHGLGEPGLELVDVLEPPAGIRDHDLVIGGLTRPSRSGSRCSDGERIDQLVDVVEPPLRMREDDHQAHPLALLPP